MKFIFIILSILFAIGCSIGAGHREIITYHKLTKEQKKVLGRIVKEKYEVRKGTKIKNGKYERYDLNFLRLEQGNYVNGQKTGVWKIWNEEDEIWIERDIDQNGKENPIINQDYLKYPIIVVEERDSLPTGRIVMKLKFDDNCQLEQLELINGIDNEFDSIIVNKYKRYARLSKKVSNSY
ncbi:MAG: hypothetical protein IPG55_07285 [Saprospiraceae bacterium]|nr:hypothetical protein [Candidatus Defluviibacterium haderslevense]